MKCREYSILVCFLQHQIIRMQKYSEILYKYQNNISFNIVNVSPRQMRVDGVVTAIVDSPTCARGFTVCFMGHSCNHLSTMLLLADVTQT